MAERKWHPETLAVVAGRPASPGAPMNVPPTFTSTYRDGGPVGYGRWDNPTWSAFEETLGQLEGGHCVSFASGQAAVSSLLGTLPPGSLVTFAADAYNGTRSLMARLEASGAIRLRPVDVVDTNAVLAGLEGSAMLWLESPTNPMLGVADLPVILGAARKSGVTTVVDNTFATPLVQQPLALGATAVVHSATKYIGGHSDLLLGAVVVKDGALRDRLVQWRTFEGAIPGVMEAYLALRGLRTLPVRLERQQRTAALLAERLDGDPHVIRVRYPGLATDPNHQRAKAQMAGYGAMISFEVADAETADRVLAALQLIVNATSLGGVESTIERRSRWAGEENTPPGLLRLSVGLEHPDDLWADLQESLRGVSDP